MEFMLKKKKKRKRDRPTFGANIGNELERKNSVLRE